MANKLPYEQVEVLSDQQLTLEKWMLRLRLSDGFPQSWLETPSQQQKLHTLIENGHIVAHPKKKDHYRLSPLGFALSDQIILELCP